jgi:hypothetical protein
MWINLWNSVKTCGLPHYKMMRNEHLYPYTWPDKKVYG